MNGLTVLSLFDGISCGRVALERADIPVSKYYASEVDKYAIKISAKNWPDVMQIGDIKNVWARNLPKIDLLIGGSPCQDLSIAKGNRQGLKGSQSSLFWHYVRLLRTCKPKYFLLENVASMPKAAKEEISRVLGVEPILINSALMSAQQRKRLYWTNIPGVMQPEDKGLLLKDILEGGLTDREKARAMTSSIGRTTYREYIAKQQNTVAFEPITKRSLANIKIEDQKANCLQASSYKGAQANGMINIPMRIGDIGNGGQGDRIYSISGKSICLNANSGGVGSFTGLYKIDLPDGLYTIRKLSPIECERLQTLPDNYTEGVSNTQRYKALGNGWTVDVIAHIFQGLKIKLER